MSGYLVLDGTSGNAASISDSVATSIVGEVDLRFGAAATDWTSSQAFISKRKASGTFEYELRSNATGNLELYWHSGAGFVQPGVSTVAIPFSDGAFGWVQATREINGANYDVKYYTSSDGSTWAQLGATVSIATASNAPGDSTQGAYVGSQGVGTAQMFTGDVYRAQIYSGIDGTLAFDARFDQLSAAEVAAGSFTESSANAATVTINGAAWSYVFRSGDNTLAGPGQLLVTGG